MGITLSDSAVPSDILSTMRILVAGADEGTRAAFDAAFPGEAAYVDRLDADCIAAHHDAEVVSLFIRNEFKKPEIDAFPNLKLIATRSTGFDHIDVAYAKERGIVVSTVPKYGSHTVAEFAFALLLSLSGCIQVADDSQFPGNSSSVQQAPYNPSSVPNFSSGRLPYPNTSGALGGSNLSSLGCRPCRRS